MSNVVRTTKWPTKRQPNVPLIFLPHFYVFCDQLLNSIIILIILFLDEILILQLDWPADNYAGLGGPVNRLEATSNLFTFLFK